MDNDGYASHPDVIAVGACNDRGRRSAYSDWGNGLWCCFPSDDALGQITNGIWTTDRLGEHGYNSGDPDLGHEHGDYTNNFGGTSSACPGVAGLAALMLAKNPARTASEIRDIVADTCDQIDTVNGQYDANGHSVFYGHGRVNAANAVNAA
jgi:subtilisin family serine protease